MTRTVIEVAPERVRLRPGLLRGQQIPTRPGWTRIGLLATAALLLAGDEVDLHIVVAAGARLDLFDVAGTVAYDGRGASACWYARVEIGAGAVLRWAGEPFVVAGGADVQRTLDVQADPTAAVAIRDTLVLGRTGESTGRLRNRTSLRCGGVPVLLEDQLIEPRSAALPGLLGTRRIIDTVTHLGPASAGDAPAPAVRYVLTGGGGTVTRYLGTELADSPLHAWRWADGG